MTPPVDERISALGDRTATIGEKVLLAHGARLIDSRLIIPTEQTVTQAPELFKLSGLTTFWDPAWSLERRDLEGPAAAFPEFAEIRTWDGNALAVFPRDEVRGALLRRTVDLNDKPSLSVDVGADAGRAWRLVIFVNNDKLLSQLIQGDSLKKESGSEHLWKHIDLDLSNYRNQSVVIRLYDLVLVPGFQAGNSYWRNPQIH